MGHFVLRVNSFYSIFQRSHRTADSSCPFTRSAFCNVYKKWENFARNNGCKSCEKGPCKKKDETIITSLQHRWYSPLIFRFSWSKRHHLIYRLYEILTNILTWRRCKYFLRRAQFILPMKCEANYYVKALIVALWTLGKGCPTNLCRQNSYRISRPHSQ